MKTISDKAIELYPLRNIGGVAEFQQSAFKKGAEFAQRWIPVEEELPEQGEEVLVKDFGDCITVGYCSYNFWNVDTDSVDYSNITHWRPIELT